jgi:hypothetical protein
MIQYHPNRGSERPQIEGFYWAKYRGMISGCVCETVVKIYATGLLGGSVKSPSVPNTVCWDGVCVSVDDDRLLEFAGPIPRPERS